MVRSERQREKKRKKSVGKSQQNIKKVHALCAFFLVVRPVTSYVMVKISVIYSKANNIAYRLNVRLNMSQGK